MSVVTTLLAFTIVVYTPYVALAYRFKQRGLGRSSLLVIASALILTLASILVPVVLVSLGSILVMGLLAADFMEGRLTYPKLLGYSIAGTLSGFITAAFWSINSELALYYNLPAVELGYFVYEAAIKSLGDPTSPYAHYTIPVFLRVPWVTILTSIASWSLVGVCLELLSRLFSEPKP
ncbi:hypothetical protein apy_16240 [Aeropyrum pernix]|uniref:Uncharacterized protein n=1 Tax=Aeropyrum pernix TaxID=56636 RepID=A0A401HC33_AERPX|nr:hypothetical protein [Aeropyrum pernix]GBF09899.1 hypothetical protein apy_16240 [Aeropyrum pernix]